MAVKITWKVDTRVAEQIARQMPARIENMLKALSEDMTEEIKAGFGTGGDYKAFPSHADRAVIHWTAPPGSPPNPDTDELRRSLHWEKVNAKSYRIYDGVEYGVFQELGTRSGGWNGSGHAERPFVRPVFRKYSDATVLKDYAKRARIMEP